MSYTKQQAINAMLQYPELVKQMALSDKELVLATKYKKITKKELEKEFTSKSNGSRFMQSLISKGYFKRVSWGVFERVESF